MDISHHEGFNERDRLYKIQRIIKACTEQLEVARVSVWSLNEARNAIKCEVLYVAATDSFDSCDDLKEESFPAYFRAIKGSRLINAHDAMSDPRTCEFTDVYLRPLNIYAMLDAPIFTGGKLYGVLCLEHINEPRAWDVAEMSYAAAAADTISLINEHDTWLQTREELAIFERCDVLTGLENRLHFQHRLDRDQKNSSYSTSALMLMGLDAFTGVNDHYGHKIANEVLYQLTERLQHLAQRYQAWPARVGGDQFALWIPNLTDNAVVEKLINHINTAMEIPFCIKGVVLDVTASVGVVVNSRSHHLDNVFRCAEVAMLAAKKKGRGEVQYFSSNFISEISERRQLELEVLRALDNDQLCVYYQPIVNHDDYKVAGLEALVRWNHPSKGVLPPVVFLELVSELGLMSRLGEIVLKQECNDILELEKKGLGVDWVSVNLSAEQLHSTEFVTFLAKLLEKVKLPRSCLELEIIEEQIAHDSALVKSQLKEISELGVGMSIDDFGTGHSSLYRLKHLPVTKLKIDKSFVDGLPSLEEDRCIASAIIGLAKGMGLGLVAEGVETLEQARWLGQQGCEYLQGYYFAKPKPLDRLINYLRSENK